MLFAIGAVLAMALFVAFTLFAVAAFRRETPARWPIAIGLLTILFAAVSTNGLIMASQQWDDGSLQHRQHYVSGVTTWISSSVQALELSDNQTERLLNGEAMVFSINAVSCQLQISKDLANRQLVLITASDAQSGCVSD